MEILKSFLLICCLNVSVLTFTSDYNAKWVAFVARCSKATFPGLDPFLRCSPDIECGNNTNCLEALRIRANCNNKNYNDNPQCVQCNGGNLCLKMCQIDSTNCNDYKKLLGGFVDWNKYEIVSRAINEGINLKDSKGNSILKVDNKNISELHNFIVDLIKNNKYPNLFAGNMLFGQDFCSKQCKNGYTGINLTWPVGQCICK